MSQAGISALLSLTAIVAVVGLLKVLRDQTADWNISATFIFVMGWLYGLPAAFSSFAGGKVRSFSPVRDPISILSSSTIQLTHICNYLLLAVSLLTILVRASRLQRLNAPAVVATLLCTASGLVAAANNFGILSKSSATLAAALIAVAFLPAGRGACLGAAAFVLSLASLSGFLTIVNYSLATAPCAGLYKCGALGVFIFGVADNENGLALILASGVVFVWLSIRDRRWRTGLFCYVLGMIGISGSRTSAIAAVLLLVALSLSRHALHAAAAPISPRHRQITILGLSAAVLGAAVTGALLPFLTSDPVAFTYRGNVWLIARERLVGHYGIGLSQPGWASLVDNGVVGTYAGYSVHNQWLDVLWISGAFGMVLFILMLILLCRRDAVMGLVLLLPMAVLGITERAWSIAHFDDYSFAYLASLIAIPAIVRTVSETAPHWPDQVRTSKGAAALTSA